MNRIILTAAAVAFTIVLLAGTDIQAKGPKSSSGSSHPHVNAAVTIHSNTIRLNNVHVNARLSSFRNWNSYCYFNNHRCYGYCVDHCWYYWYAPMQCYLPISYMSIYPPTPFVGGPGIGLPAVGINTVAPVGTGLPALPPGATPVNAPPTLPGSPMGESLPMVP